MRSKKCKHCGAVFETDQPGAYLCPACALSARQKSVYRQRVCIDCGRTFMGFPRSKRCPECQDEVSRARNRAYRKNGPARKLGSTDRCEACGAEYIVTSGLQRYCPDCSEKENLKNTRAHKREYQHAYMSEEPRRAEKEANRSNNKVCKICGKTFDTGRTDVYCSEACRKIGRARIQAAADKARSPRNYYQTKIRSMTPDEYRAYRDRLNEAARKRREAKQNDK